MIKRKNYAGIDYFRIVAAVMIIAIHTSPLGSFTETGDFILTRIISRVAVPFFFMTSGFFLISRYAENTDKLWAFVKKTTQIYAVAILIYIPINLYNGYFSMDNLLPNIIKDIVFDGTLYHLWYLPASILGAMIAWYLVRKLNFRKALAVAAVLYLIGLFGDSYYGIVQRIPGLSSIYTLIFQVSDYTRNGIFFAPVFFVMGGAMADSHSQLTAKKSACGFAVSFALMFAEAMALHYFDLQLHDSMYVMLLPCMYFLFDLILRMEGKRPAGLRTSSLIIYIIHPMVIVVIRLFAKVLRLQKLLVENSVVHYLAVCAASVVFGVVVTALWNKYKPKKRKFNADTGRTYLELDLNALEHNVKVLNEAMPPKCELMAIMKAEAYGHGLYEVAVHTNRIGVKAFAVATIDEGIQLRTYGITGEILILGYTAPERAQELRKFDLMQTLIDHAYAVQLNAQNIDVKAHIKIDTGMHRLGIDHRDTEKICDVFGMKHIHVCGVFTHLCSADSLEEEDQRFTRMQIENFYQTLDRIKEKGITIPKIHIQSSYGLLNYPELECDYVRMGVSLYGVLSSPNDKTKLQLDLKPALALKTRVALLRSVQAGESVGYSRAFVARRDSLIAILPVGYADGYPRSLSCGKGCVLINGQRAPIVGKVCMDQMAVDVTDVTDVQVGSIVTLVGKDGNEELSTPMVADFSGSISNELLSRMGSRVKIVT